MDFLTKEILRCFNIYEEYDRASNDDVDQFIPFRKNNFTYFEDDFVLMQKNVILPPSLHSTEIKHIQFEPKDKTKAKAQVATIDWSHDGRFIVVVFKVDV